MEHISPRVSVLDLNGIPVREISIDRDFTDAPVLRNRSHSLIATDVLRHLHVVVVRVATLHRLNRAVELCIILVYEDERILAAKPFN